MSMSSTGLSRIERGGLRPITTTMKEAGRLSGLGQTTLWKLIKEGRLEVARVDGRTLPLLQSLEDLLTPKAATTERPNRVERAVAARQAQRAAQAADRQ